MERETEREKKKNNNIFFAPLAEFNACRGPYASPVFRCCDNQGKRGERNGETDREKEGRGESAD